MNSQVPWPGGNRKSEIQHNGEWGALGCSGGGQARGAGIVFTVEDPTPPDLRRGNKKGSNKK